MIVRDVMSFAAHIYFNNHLNISSKKNYKRSDNIHVSMVINIVVQEVFKSYFDFNFNLLFNFLFNFFLFQHKNSLLIWLSYF